MQAPDGDFHKMKSVTKTIILANVIFFFIVISLIPILGDESFVNFFKSDIAFTPSTFLQHPWTLITSMFMHAPGEPIALLSSHLIVNMLSLLFLGTFLEKIIGSKRMLLLYFVGGIAGSLLMLGLFYVSSDARVITLSVFVSDAMAKEGVSAVGASAAIFALAGCLAVLVPKIPVLVFFFIPMQLWKAIVFLAVVLTLIPGVANSAHIGGLIAGVAYAIYLRKKHRKKVIMLNRMLGFG